MARDEKSEEWSVAKKTTLAVDLSARALLMTTLSDTELALYCLLGPTIVLERLLFENDDLTMSVASLLLMSYFLRMKTLVGTFEYFLRWNLKRKCSIMKLEVPE
ncbi:MAG: hypothetical protein Q9212_000389 [Teloschistes hypoglaucus]